MSESLKPGSLLEIGSAMQYRIESILGRGGFGITYLATDLNLQTEVAIKEYLPSDFAERTSDSSVVPKTGTDGDLFRWGLDRFIDEARILAKFKHPNIVRVLNVFPKNNTAYMVMEYEEGLSFDQVLKSPIYRTEHRLIELFDAILDGLAQVHKHNIIHRDIKPANIYIRNDGSPVLLDFGSARKHLSDRSQAMTRIMTKGYAPYEQAVDCGEPQGPWSDIYSLGVTLYYAITKAVPPDSPSRFSNVIQARPDPMRPLAELEVAKNYTGRFLQAVQQALEVMPNNRPQSAEAFRQLLNPDYKPAESAAGMANNATVMATRLPDLETSEISSALTSPPTQYGGADSRRGGSISGAEKSHAPAPAPATNRKPVPWLLIGGAAGLIIASTLAAWIFLNSDERLSTSDSSALVSQDIPHTETDNGLGITEPTTVVQGTAEELQYRSSGAGKKVATETETAIKTYLPQPEPVIETPDLNNTAETEPAIQATSDKITDTKMAAGAMLGTDSVTTADKAFPTAIKTYIGQETPDSSKPDAPDLEEPIKSPLAEPDNNLRDPASTNTVSQLDTLGRQAAIAPAPLPSSTIPETAPQASGTPPAPATIPVPVAKKPLVDTPAKDASPAKPAAASKAVAVAPVTVAEQPKQTSRPKTEASKPKPAVVKKPPAAAKPAPEKTVIAARKKTTPTYPVAKPERQRQDKESDLQSIGRLIVQFRDELRNCDTKSLRNIANGSRDSIEFVDSLCEQYAEMDLKINNIQSNASRGTASANITIQRLRSSSGDTVIPSSSWNTLPLKLKKSSGYWGKVEW